MINNRSVDIGSSSRWLIQVIINREKIVNVQQRLDETNGKVEFLFNLSRRKENPDCLVQNERFDSKIRNLRPNGLQKGARFFFDGGSFVVANPHREANGLKG